MATEYTSRHVAALYDLNNQTVHNWAQEFARHLSPNANPGKSRPRMFNAEDMKVISKIAEMKQAGKQYQDIHAALDAGEKGDGIATSPAELDQMIEGQDRTALVTQNEDLRRQIEKLYQDLQKMRDLEVQNARLDTRITELLQQLEKAESRSDERGAEVERLREVIGELRGELKALRRQMGHSE